MMPSATIESLLEETYALLNRIRKKEEPVQETIPTVSFEFKDLFREAMTLLSRTCEDAPNCVHKYVESNDEELVVIIMNELPNYINSKMEDR